MLSPRDSGPRRLTPPQLIIVAVIFLLAFGSRIVLGWVNPGIANDNHVEVIEYIVREHRLPERAALWQAYHPKLYHASVAVLVVLFSSQQSEPLFLWAQMVNLGASCVTVILLWLYLMRLRLSFEATAFAFSLVALNPRLIGISAQPTNDAMVIMWATAAIFWGSRWFAQRQWRDFFIMALSAAAASITKGSGLVAVAVLSFHLLLESVVPPTIAGERWRRSWSMAALTSFFLLVGFMLVFDGTYFESYRTTGSPLSMNIPLKAWPPFLEPMAAGPESFRMDVMTLADAFLTFPLVDMVRSPFSLREGSLQVPSLWAHLHSAFHSLQFFAWPPGWIVERARVLSLGRMLLLAGLLPTAVLAAGLLRSGRRAAADLMPRRLLRLSGSGDLLECLMAWGFIAMIMLLTARLRELQAMKVIYILPGVLAYAGIFARELGHFQWWFARNWWRVLLVRVPLLLLLGLYVVDVTVLIEHLWSA